jgi:protein-disulfide isomerase
MMNGRQRLALRLGLGLAAATFLIGPDAARDAAAAGPPESALAPTATPAPTPAPVHIDLKDTPFEGPAKAPVKVVVYSDFLCPHCRNVAHALDRYLQQSADRVAVYYKFYPLDGDCNPNLSMHPGACWLAYGAVCAHEQNQFWPYHDKVFTLEHRPPAIAPNRGVVESVAGALKLDVAAFRTCLDSPRTKARVTSDVEEGAGFGIKGTPTLFVNGRRLAQPGEFTAAVDEEAKRLGLGASSAAK